MLARVGLAGKEHVPAKSLSYGERRALEIGVALAAEPRMLFLDEPTAGLGAEGTARLAELVGELKRQLTIVIIEHDMRFLFGLADRISVIHWGQVIARRHARRSCKQNRMGARSNLGALRMSAVLKPRRAAPMLSVDGIDTFYGETQVLFGVSLQVAAGEVRGAARAQRRRQDDHAALDPGPDAGAPRPRALRRPRHHARAPRTRSPAAASAGCRTTGASSRR